MDRATIYALEMTRSYDFQSSEIYAMTGIANAVAAIIGSGNAWYSGLSVNATSPASMTVNIAAGQVYQLSSTDTLAWGALGNNTTQITQQGYRAASSLALTNAELGAGQSQLVLLEVGFVQNDIIPSNDPNGGVLPFVNVQNPSQPWQGPNNSGSSLPTCRQAFANVQAKYGTPASTGLQVAPTPDAGYVGFALILLTYGVSTITSGNITAPSPNQNLPGLSNSHHSGNFPQAPQIKLTSEVQGVLPFANGPSSNPSPSGVTGIVTTAPSWPVFYLVNANPNTNLAGQKEDLAFQTGTQTLWVCTTAGSSSAAVWLAVTNQAVSFVYYPTSESANFNATGISGTYYRCDTSGGAVNAALPAASGSGTILIFTIVNGTQLLNINAHAGDVINNAGVVTPTGGTLDLTYGTSSGVVTLCDAASGVWEVV